MVSWMYRRPARFKLRCLLFPPTDFLMMDHQEFSIIEHDSPTSPESLLIGCPIQDCPELTAKANPITYIDDNMPAMHFFHGFGDVLVPHGQSVLLYEAMAAAGNEVRFTSVMLATITTRL